MTGIEAIDSLRAVGGGDRGITRLAWTPELGEAEAWFAGQAGALDLTVERDPAGNLWATPAAEPPWWGVGSHLDTVVDGGAWDGALGVVAGLEVARRAQVPVAVIAFADEEGARFNTPTFGSRALAGRLDPAVLDRRDASGTSLRDAMAAFGVDPVGIGAAPRWLARLRGFLELHIDQSREVWNMSVPAAVVSGLAARRRLRLCFTGRADHAGTTPMSERADALADAAGAMVAARGAAEPVRATATRVLVEPNALSTIPSRADVWLDVRAPEPAAIQRFLDGLAIPASASVDVESRSDGVAFDAHVRSALRAAAVAPEVLCYAGHDAGILAERIPAGMLLVRNERGISHAPDEEIDPSDAAAAIEALLVAVETLA